jgi:hypothetical protein
MASSGGMGADEADQHVSIGVVQHFLDDQGRPDPQRIHRGDEAEIDHAQRDDVLVGDGLPDTIRLR